METLVGFRKGKGKLGAHNLGQPERNMKDQVRTEPDWEAQTYLWRARHKLDKLCIFFHLVIIMQINEILSPFLHMGKLKEKLGNLPKVRQLRKAELGFISPQVCPVPKLTPVFIELSISDKI